MKKRKTAPDPDKPLTHAEFKSMKKWRSFDELPQDLQNAINRSRGRPKLAAPKEHINIRLDADLVAALRKSGAGWQSRLNDAVREWLSS